MTETIEKKIEENKNDPIVNNPIPTKSVMRRETKHKCPTMKIEKADLKVTICLLSVNIVLLVVLFHTPSSTNLYMKSIIESNNTFLSNQIRELQNEIITLKNSYNQINNTTQKVDYMRLFPDINLLDIITIVFILFLLHAMFRIAIRIGRTYNEKHNSQYKTPVNWMHVGEDKYGNMILNECDGNGHIVNDKNANDGKKALIKNKDILNRTVYVRDNHLSDDEEALEIKNGKRKGNGKNKITFKQAKMNQKAQRKLEKLKKKSMQ
jgi:hypothetical protein